MTERLVVAGAIRDDAGRLLLAQRDYPAAVAGLWELPGGKAEPGESQAQALVRELGEELGIEVEPAGRLAEAVPLAGGLTLVARWARWSGGTVEAREHRAVRWVTAEELAELAGSGELVPADVAWVPELLDGLAD